LVVRLIFQTGKTQREAKFLIKSIKTSSLFKTNQRPEKYNCLWKIFNKFLHVGTLGTEEEERVRVASRRSGPWESRDPLKPGSR